MDPIINPKPSFLQNFKKTWKGSLFSNLSTVDKVTISYSLFSSTMAHLLLKSPLKVFKGKSLFLNGVLLSNALVPALLASIFAAEFYGAARCTMASKEANEITNKKISVIIESNKIMPASTFLQWKRTNHILNSGREPLFYRVSTTQEMFEICEKIKSNQNKIETLWLSVHGNEYSLEIGNDDVYAWSINEKPLSFFEKTVFLLENDGTLILESCRTASSQEDHFPPIAQTIANQLLPTGKVIAASDAINSWRTKFSSEDPSGVSFYRGLKNVTVIYDKSTGKE